MYKYFLFILLYRVTTFGQITLNTSLTACYSLDGNATDLVNSLNGVINSVSSTTDRFNNLNSAIAFAGNDSSYIELPNSPLLKANEVSFSAWVNFNHLNWEQYLVFAHNGCLNYHEGYMMAVNNWVPGGFRLQMAKADNSCTLLGQATLNGLTVLNINTWYHVGFYIGSDSLKLYLNGNLETTMANSNPLLYNPNASVFLGGSTIPTFNAPLDGSMDNVRFYNRKLSGNEFMQLYSQDPICRLETVGLNPNYGDLNGIRLYPNPFSNLITIETDKLLNDKNYLIEDVSGRILLKGKLHNNDDTKIDGSELTKGVYFIKIYMNNQEIVKKLIKQ